METAHGMLKIRKYLYVGFMCHQTIEKALKAVIARDCDRGEIPEKTHNLLKLAEKSRLFRRMTEQQKKVLRILNPLNVEARYPEDKKQITEFLTAGKCEAIIAETEELLCWIKQRLQTL